MHAHTTLSRLVEKHVWLPRAFSFHSSISILFRSFLGELVYQPLANALYFSPTSCQVVLQSLLAKGNGPMYALLLTVTDAVRGRPCKTRLSDALMFENRACPTAKDTYRMMQH